MIEEQAIRRIARAMEPRLTHLLIQSGTLPSQINEAADVIDACAQAAWAEIKAIAREDAQRQGGIITDVFAKRRICPDPAAHYQVIDGHEPGQA